MNDEQLKSMSDLQLAGEANQGLLVAEATFEPIRVSIDYQSAWAILSTIQLALRHPAAPGFACTEIARQFAEKIGQRVGTDPLLREIIRRGWEAKPQ